jgi:hypothetical protein
LFTTGSAVLFGNKIKGLDDFELLAFVVVKWGVYVPIPK